MATSILHQAGCVQTQPFDLLFAYQIARATCPKRCCALIPRSPSLLETKPDHETYEPSP